MLYAIKGRVNYLVLFALSSFLIAGCSSPSVLVTNVPNYKLQRFGSKNKEHVLFFEDPACSKNDSLRIYFKKEGLGVISVQKHYSDPLRNISEDHASLRNYESLDLLAELSKEFTISYVAASGFEVHQVTNWFMTAGFKGAYLYPYYPTSLKEELIRSIGTNSPYLKDYHLTTSALDLYLILLENPAPSGTIGTYSYRYLNSIWEQSPKHLTVPYEEVLKIQVID
jgi:hypothetical protein